MSKVLIIDDAETHRMIYRAWLEDAGYEVVEAANRRDGFGLILSLRPDCIILDYLMGRDSGFHMLHDMSELPEDFPPVIFVSCAMEEALRRNAMALGAFACFEKSVLTREEMVCAVAAAVTARAAA